MQIFETYKLIVVSEAAKISGSYEIHLPAEDINGNSIEYTPGLYKLEAYCKDDLYTSQIVTYGQEVKKAFDMLTSNVSRPLSINYYSL